MKLMLPLLVTPPTVTVTEPLLDAVGTLATICVSVQLVIAAALFENATVPAVLPKPLPLIWTAVPTGPLVGDRDVMTGLAVVKTTSALLFALNPLMVTGPVVALAGTVATIWVSPQVVIAALKPLK